MDFLEFTIFTEHNFHGVYGVLKSVIVYYGTSSSSWEFTNLRNIIFMEFMEF